MITLSIIIPAYNVGEFLEAAVKSIGNVDNKVEIIIVNDGSTDDTLMIATQLQQEIPQIRIMNQTNMGLAQSRNNAIKSAKGKYLMFLDGDDRYKNDAVLRVLKVLQQNAPELIIYNVEDYDIVKKQVVKITLHGKKVKRAGSVYWNKVYDARLFKGVDAPTGHLFEDSAVIPFIVSKATSIILIEQVLYTYSVNRANSIMSQNFNINFKEKVYALEYLSQLSDQSDLNVSKKNEVYDYILANIAFVLRQRLNLKNIDLYSLRKMIKLIVATQKKVGLGYLGVFKYIFYQLLIMRAKFYEKVIK